MHIRISLVAVAVGLTLAASAGARTSEEPVDDQPPVERAEVVPSTITGTLRLYGCAVDGEAIEVRAQPLEVVDPSGMRHVADPRAAERRTFLEQATNRHLYRFSIRGLQPATLYRLQVLLHPLDACGTVLWRAPADGLAVSGGRPVALEGFAVRTTVEVRDANGAWVGADELRVDDPAAAVRTFRWRSLLPGVVGGELKVSLTPFPMEPLPAPCAEPEDGVVYRRTLTFRADERADVVSLDLAGILGARAGDGPDATALRPFLAGAPLYVRVVPALAEGLACDPEEHGFAGSVALAKIPGGGLPPVEPPAPLPPVIPGDNNAYAPPYLGEPAEGHPTYQELAYKVIRPHTLPPTKCTTTWEDVFGCVLINLGAAPGSTLQPGNWFFFTPNSGGGSSDPFSSFVSSIGNLGAAIYAGAGLAVNWANTAWEDIKTTVVKVVVDVIQWVPGVEQACNALKSTTGKTCDDVVRAGLEAGLMAMGVPPSIPNWDQLQEQGIDYLAAEMATQIEASTGVPSELSEAALKELAKEALERIGETRGSGSGLPNWLMPYIGFEPAVLTVSLREVGNAPIPSGLRLFKFQDFLYAGAEVPIPRVFPQSGILRFPVVLQPRLDVFAPPLCRSSFGVVTCVPLLGASPVCQYRSTTPGAVDEWLTLPCSATNWPDVYYRDRWRTERFHKLPCVQLDAAALLTGVFGIPIWSPEHSFTMTARVQPPVAASWNGPTYNGC